MRAVELYDSTLRDGAQARGIAFSIEDKLNIIRALDELGIPFIEAGNPASNPKDFALFERARHEMALCHAELVAFGATRHRLKTAREDPLCQRLLESGARTVALFGKSWVLHVREILGASLDENLAMIGDTVRFFTGCGRRVFYDAEHFFDGYRDDPAYALRTLSAAADAGAARLVLCDTNGGTFPDEIAGVVREVARRFSIPVGIHCHDDAGCAVAGSMAAVAAGATQVQGTLLGFGERCGNANLSCVLANLQLKGGCLCIPPARMRALTTAARYVAEIANVLLPPQLPYVGMDAFAHKGGMHIDAVGKLPRSFEHVEPEQVGNERDLLLSEMSGRAGLLAKVAAIAPDLRKDSAQTAELMALLKSLEHQGYQFESATASFELLVLRHLGAFEPPYRVELFKIIGEQSGEQETRLSSAMVKVRVGDRCEITADEGEGPVNALDRALRKALEAFYPIVRSMRLTDYKVRVMEPDHATAAQVRVIIESTDGALTWTTVGVSSDIINASFHALTDSIDYKLYRSKTN